MLGLFFTGAYILKGVQQVLHGPRNEKWSHHAMEISVREVLIVAPLMVLMLLAGIWPAWLVTIINQTVMRLVG